jgi:nucleoid DNA-binding protein
MNKLELIEQVAARTGQSKSVARDVLDGLLDTFEQALVCGNTIEIRGFGSFKVKRRESQNARNPRTGEKVEIPSRFVPVFKPSKTLSEKLDK